MSRWEEVLECTFDGKAIVAQLTRIADALERAHPTRGYSLTDAERWRAAEVDLRAVVKRWRTFLRSEGYSFGCDDELDAIIARHWGEP